jgi:hypothetical protein
MRVYTSHTNALFHAPCNACFSERKQVFSRMTHTVDVRVYTSHTNALFHAPCNAGFSERVQILRRMAHTVDAVAVQILFDTLFHGMHIGTRDLGTSSIPCTQHSDCGLRVHLHTVNTRLAQYAVQLPVKVPMYACICVYLYMNVFLCIYPIYIYILPRAYMLCSSP